MMSVSPSGISAAELMASARTGTTTAPIPNLPLIESGDDDLSPLSPSSPITPTSDVASFTSSITLATTPGTSFAPKTVVQTVLNENEEDEEDEENENETVMGDQSVRSRDMTPLGLGPSLLSQTAPNKGLVPQVNEPAATPSGSTTLSSESTPRPSAPATANTTPHPPSAPLGQTVPVFPSSPPQPSFHIKIADLGNATPIAKKFTNDIQTRQYRSPEAILGMTTWDEKVDVFSVACLVFELLTGEYLFNPKSRQGGWTKDDDHIAQMVELMGGPNCGIGKGVDDGFTKEMKTEGRYSREIWRSNGTLRNISKLHHWPLARVMIDKYDYTPEEAELFASFMNPMLVIDPKLRASARDMLNHPWLSS